MKRILDFTKAKFRRDARAAELQEFRARVGDDPPPKEDAILWEARLDARGLDLAPVEAREFLADAPDKNHRFIPLLRVIAGRDAAFGIFNISPDPWDEDELLAQPIPMGLPEILAWRFLERAKRIVICGTGIPTPSEPPILDVLKFLHSRGYNCAGEGGTPGFVDVALYQSQTERPEQPAGDQVELVAVQVARARGRVVERPDSETIPEPDIQIVQSGMRRLGYIVIDVNVSEAIAGFK